MKRFLSNSEIDNALSHCIDIINKEKSGIQEVHIVSLYRGSLPFGVKLSNHLNAPLSIIDYQSYDGYSKEPNFIKNAGITPDDLIFIVEDIVDRGLTMKLTEEYIRKLYPYNKIVIYSVVGSKKHPNYYYYTYEHNDDWIVFATEIINDTRCKVCVYSEPCRDNLETHSHCNLKNKSFINQYTCSDFKEK